MGILISTNKDYKIIKIGKSFIGEKVVYDFNKKQFTIGANFFDYIKVGERNFSAWQPVIIKIDLNFNGQSYFIKKPYSCILENMVIEKEEIIIFTRSLLSQEKSFEINGKSEIIRVRVSTYKFHNDNERPWIQILEPISNHETSTNIGTILISNISNIDSAFYFTTSNLNQSTLKNINHLYQFKNNKLTELSSFQNYLKWNDIINESSDWVNINEFTVNSSKNYIFLTHEGASKKEMILYKTDTSFNTLHSTKIALNDYADFNKMLVLSNGNIAILMANKKDTWSYYLYDSKMQFIKEIDSKIPKEYYPNNLKEIAKDRIECFYYIDNVKKKDCMIQIIN